MSTNRRNILTLHTILYNFFLRMCSVNSCYQFGLLQLHLELKVQCSIKSICEKLHPLPNPVYYTRLFFVNTKMTYSNTVIVKIGVGMSIKKVGPLNKQTNSLSEFCLARGIFSSLVQELELDRCK